MLFVFTEEDATYQIGQFSTSFKKIVSYNNSETEIWLSHLRPG
jgi:hypothetical protein